MYPHLYVGLAAATLVAACSKPVPVAEDIRPVRVMQVAAAQTSSAAELPGEVRPRVESRVGFQVSGRIAGRAVGVGQFVKRGQRLATIDGADYQLAAAASRAQVTTAQVDRDQQRADFRRFEDLHRRGFISGADLERRKSQLDSAEARHAQADAQSDVSGNQAGYAVLRAPGDGVVTAIDAEVGQVVAAGQSVVRIAMTGDKEVVVAIPESRLDALRRITDVRVRLWANAAELRGRVREIAPLADAATRTFPARIALIDAPAEVALGMSATVIFEAPLPAPVIALPLQALLKEGETTYVWQLDRDAMTVRRSPISVANIAGNDVVVGSGVAPGDTIVTAGVHLLREGQKVKLLDGANVSSAPLSAARK